MDTGRQSPLFQTSDHTTELEIEDQEMIEAMLEETMEKFEQQMSIQKYREQGNNYGQEMTLLSPISVFALPRLTIDYDQPPPIRWG